MIYEQRNAILDLPALNEQIASLREGCFNDLVRQFVPKDSVEEQWNLAGLEAALREEWQLEVPLLATVEKSDSMEDEDIVRLVVKAANDAFQAKLDQVQSEQFHHYQRMVLLQTIDTHWRDHLTALDHLRQGIHLRSYAQKQPKQEYKREAYELFGQMLTRIKNDVTQNLMTLQVQSSEQFEEIANEIEERGEQISNVVLSAPDESGTAEEKSVRDALFAPASGQSLRPEDLYMVGRNEPCPCGSGKKFKQCHGKLS